MATYDAILILGGGLLKDGELPPWARNRFDLALEVESGEPIVCLSAATVHKPPPLDSRGFPIFESAAGAQYLLSKGVPAHRLYLESCSWDTIGNAFFSKLVHVDPAGWRKLRVITSAFHMPRSKAVFEWVYSLDPDRSYNLHFSETPDVGLDPQTMLARRAKEAEALEKFRELPRSITSISELHRWLFTAHGAYSASARPDSDRLEDSSLLASY